MISHIILFIYSINPQVEHMVNQITLLLLTFEYLLIKTTIPMIAQRDKDTL